MHRHELLQRQRLLAAAQQARAADERQEPVGKGKVASVRWVCLLKRVCESVGCVYVCGVRVNSWVHAFASPARPS